MNTIASFSQIRLKYAGGWLGSPHQSARNYSTHVVNPTANYPQWWRFRALGLPHSIQWSTWNYHILLANRPWFRPNPDVNSISHIGVVSNCSDLSAKGSTHKTDGWSSFSDLNCPVGVPHSDASKMDILWLVRNIKYPISPSFHVNIPLNHHSWFSRLILILFLKQGVHTEGFLR
jgi:hypothetical protein